jgi:hypothetical protein
MAWPWRDLLFLHGHITDLELARRLAALPPAQLPSSSSHHVMAPGKPAHRAIVVLRRCLGIGDGDVRTQ